MKNIPCKIDIQDLDYSLADIIVKGVSSFRDNKDCYPSSLNSVEEWDKILQTIIEGFESAKIMSGNDNMDPYDLYNEGMDLLKKYFFDLWF